MADSYRDLSPNFAPLTSNEKYIRNFLEAIPGSVAETFTSKRGIGESPTGPSRLDRAGDSIVRMLSGDAPPPAPVVAPVEQAVAPRYVRSMSEAEFNQGGLGQTAAPARDPNAPLPIDDLKAQANLREFVNPIRGGDDMAIKRMQGHTNLLPQTRGVRHMVDGGGEWTDEGATPTSSQSQWEAGSENRQVAMGQGQQNRAMTAVAAGRDAELAALERANAVAKSERDILENTAAAKWIVENQMPYSENNVKLARAINKNTEYKAAFAALSTALANGAPKEQVDAEFTNLIARIAAEAGTLSYKNQPDVPGTAFATGQ